MHPEFVFLVTGVVFCNLLLFCFCIILFFVCLYSMEYGAEETKNKFVCACKSPGARGTYEDTRSVHLAQSPGIIVH